MPYVDDGRDTIIWNNYPTAYPPENVTDRELNGDGFDACRVLQGCMLAGDEMGFSFKKAFSKKSLRKVFSKKNLRAVLKVTKVVGGAVAIVCPPAGAAIAGAAIAADKVVSAVGKGGKVAAAAKATIQHTEQLAQAGDPGAERGLQLIRKTEALRKKRGVPAGQPMKVTPAAHAAYKATLPLVVRPVAARATGLQAAQLIAAAKEGTPAERKSAAAVFQRTRARAGQGDPSAAKHLIALKAAAGAYEQLQAPQAGPRGPMVFVVNAQGRVLRRRAA